MSTVAAKEERLDLVFHALSDRTRRALMHRLASEGTSKITDLAEPFAMSLPAVSKHLRVLEDARLVSRAVDGRVHRFRLVPESLAPADVWLDGYRSFWEDTLEALANYAERTPVPNKRGKRKSS
ncbi:MAG TPA: metalloregulator ArsR/SmtB family transcription factor [Bryobacteraceae bacterium]|jgi:DNA-binding transcriptional ArsR family regulator